MGKVVLPAEWENQDTVQITWPNANTDWKATLDDAISCYQKIARAVVERQMLLVVTSSVDETKQHLSDLDQAKIIYVEIPIDDTWTRDHGGISVRLSTGQYAVCDFRFNGWGGKFDADLDNQITKRMFEHSCFDPGVIRYDYDDFILEGGGIESDGKGTIMTTAACLLNKNRNASLSKEEIEAVLSNRLGANSILWLDHGELDGDDTDAHIDTLARFCDERTIAYVSCDDKEDSHYEGLRMMELQLRQFRMITGDPYELIGLPMVPCIFDDQGNRLPATYANFLIINDAVLVPVYGFDSDEIALKLLADVFKDRKVVGIDCRVLIKQHGSLHCVTMQYPAGILNKRKK